MVIINCFFKMVNSYVDECTWTYVVVHDVTRGVYRLQSTENVLGFFETLYLLTKQ